MSISLGAIFGGPGKTSGMEVFRRLCEAFEAQRTSEAPFLNVVFHFPGSVLSPEHTGLRTGRFSKKEQGFMIQVAVPDFIATSTDCSQISEYMLRAIQEAVEISRPRWAKHQIAFDFEAANLAIQTVAEQASITSAI